MSNEIRIQRAKGGFIVIDEEEAAEERKEREGKKSKDRDGGCMPCCYEPPTPRVYTTLDSLFAALEQRLGKKK